MPELFGLPSWLGRLPFSLFQLLHLHNVCHALLAALGLATMAAPLQPPSEAPQDVMLHSRHSFHHSYSLWALHL